MTRTTNAMAARGAAILAAWAAVGLAAPARGDTYLEFEVRKRNADTAYHAGEIDKDDWVNRKNDAWADYVRQQRTAAIPQVGGATFADGWHAVDVPLGTTARLEYRTFDTSTEFPTGVDPDIARVDWYVNDNPRSLVYTFHASSYDVLGNFGFDFTANPGITNVRGVPYDPFGQLIHRSGLEDWNVAVADASIISVVPEPASLLLLGMIGLPFMRRRRV